MYGIRFPKTTQEHRANEAHSKEYGVKVVRNKRKGYNLPTSWEDKEQSRSRSWKQKKLKKQYLKNIK